MGSIAAAYLGLGSNLGDRVGNLRAALRMLEADGDCEVAAVSSAYLTRPVGIQDQPDFVNAVAAVHTGLSPTQLLDRCLDVESKLGRRRTLRWGPRVIDIDILTYGVHVCSVVVREETLSIPHPRMMERAFVLVPLAEIAPDLILADGSTALQAAGRVDREGVRLIADRRWFEEKDGAV